MEQIQIKTKLVAPIQEKIFKKWVGHNRSTSIDDVFGGYSDNYEIIVLTIYKTMPSNQLEAFKKLTKKLNITFREDWGDGIDYEFWGNHTDDELEIVDFFVSLLDSNDYCFSHYLSDTGEKIYQSICNLNTNLLT